MQTSSSEIAVVVFYNTLAPILAISINPPEVTTGTHVCFLERHRCIFCISFKKITRWIFVRAAVSKHQTYSCPPTVSAAQNVKDKHTLSNINSEAILLLYTQRSHYRLYHPLFHQSQSFDHSSSGIVHIRPIPFYPGPIRSIPFLSHPIHPGFTSLLFNRAVEEQFGACTQGAIQRNEAPLCICNKVFANSSSPTDSGLQAPRCVPYQNARRTDPQPQALHKSNTFPIPNATRLGVQPGTNNYDCCTSSPPYPFKPSCSSKTALTSCWAMRLPSSWSFTRSAYSLSICS